MENFLDEKVKMQNDLNKHRYRNWLQIRHQWINALGGLTKTEERNLFNKLNKRYPFDERLQWGKNYEELNS